MLNTNSTYIVIGVSLLVISAALNAARREFIRSRRDRRLCQLVLSGVRSLEGVQVRSQGRNLAWQECGTTTGGRG